MYLVLKILLCGYVVLISAIVINILALRIGITTWYPFLNEVGKLGFIKAFIEISLISKIFLFIIYPLILGLSAFIILRNIR